MSDQLTRRTFMRTAAVGAATVSTLGLLAACAQEEKPAEKDSMENDSMAKDEKASSGPMPTPLPAMEQASNFDVIYDSKTEVGTTYENLMSAITGETGATTKYEAFAKVADKEGFAHIARLFRCTADAEKIHIELEFELASKMNPDAKKPSPPAVDEHGSGINLISGANGEIYETSDMYPAFIKKAQEEGEKEAVQVFTRAKLAEAYHAKWYLDAYNTIDTPTDDKYYLCPDCGYIHKGEDFTACPICKAPKERFTAY